MGCRPELPRPSPTHMFVQCITLKTYAGAATPHWTNKHRGYQDLVVSVMTSVCLSSPSLNSSRFFGCSPISFSLVCPDLTPPQKKSAFKRPGEHSQIFSSTKRAIKQRQNQRDYYVWLTSKFDLFAKLSGPYTPYHPTRRFLTRYRLDGEEGSGCRIKT